MTAAILTRGATSNVLYCAWSCRGSAMVKAANDGYHEETSDAADKIKKYTWT
jgi:hypothetical protein